MRKIAVFLVLACAAFGQKKPVTLEALQDFRSTVARDVPGDPVWAPDGKTFVFISGGPARARKQVNVWRELLVTD